ncbi:hypothetical protein CTAYLR_002932 [Chrysophaeum taylorii]|uniref:Trichohyalin-plectin-homology domain-containing protein n=1 Tax=Chrysophaeum taylorii TaxID=2483200 RepID=A0AAD7UMV2_9STRA|nr:hypothetical protein CTAYLR_002932 [Chrysophaeum taylorii]
MSRNRIDEFATLGVSREDAKMHQDGPKALARARAAEVLAKKFADRDRVKAKILEDQEVARARMRQGREEKLKRWKQRTQHSPFLVDLVAEHERLDEENKVRLDAEARRARALEKKRIALQQQVIVRALREDNDLDALRREKRAIVDEERRLKALLDLEKVQSRAKVDLLAAERAERQRKAAKSDIRRQNNIHALHKARAVETELLRVAADVPAAPDNTFSASDLSCKLLEKSNKLA